MASPTRSATNPRSSGMLARIRTPVDSMKIRHILRHRSCQLRVVLGLLAQRIHGPAYLSNGVLQQAFGLRDELRHAVGVLGGRQPLIARVHQRGG